MGGDEYVVAGVADGIVDDIDDLALPLVVEVGFGFVKQQQSVLLALQ